MTRELSDDELEWLEEHPLGESHAVMGGEALAACESEGCDWTAQAETFEFLMTQVTDHLEETYTPLNRKQKVQRAIDFREKFGWDPWADGALSEDGTDTHVFDVLAVTEIVDEEVVEETFYMRDLEDDTTIVIHTAEDDDDEEWEDDDDEDEDEDSE